MEPQKKDPIRRDERLYPLSHDHHGGLVFALRLKKGVTKNADVNEIGDYIRYFWDNELVRHFQDEEAYLLSLLPDDHELKKQTLQEHSQIRDTVDQILRAPGKEKIMNLSTLVNDHIRFEERVLFPYLEKNLSNKQLNDIGDSLMDSDFCDTWENQFWK